jgi:hypothetical protein
MELYQEYTDICQKYVDGFAKKQGLTFERWAGDVVGDTAVFSKSYFYKMYDIVHDVNTNQPRYLIRDWLFENDKKDVKIGYKEYINTLKLEGEYF